MSGKAEILAIQGTCPYLQSMKDKKTVSCECAHFKFPDKIARREIIYAFCAHPSAYNDCFFKRAMDRYYYERKYACEDGKQGNKMSFRNKKPSDKI